MIPCSPGCGGLASVWQATVPSQTTGWSWQLEQVWLATGCGPMASALSPPPRFQPPAWLQAQRALARASRGELRVGRPLVRLAQLVGVLSAQLARAQASLESLERLQAWLSQDPSDRSMALSARR